MSVSGGTLSYGRFVQVELLDQMGSFLFWDAVVLFGPLLGFPDVPGLY